jgi:pantoate--beta-alanine ligase
MLIFNTISEIQHYLKTQQRAGKKIGFVPTMGALHAGHISLIERAKTENDLVVCSIFVNPTQFNNPDDLKKYPRTLELDCKLLLSSGCDVVFAPSAEEMYPNLPHLRIDFGTFETVMEGKFRPGHFSGVGIVVSKLFNIVKPVKAYFGQKDLQQVAVIRRMVEELSFDLEIIPCPTWRETDGLAMSSRNSRLSAEARTLAPQIYKALNLAKAKLQNVHKSNLQTGKERLRYRILLTEFAVIEEPDSKHLSNKTVQKGPCQQKKLFHHESKHNELNMWKEKTPYQKKQYFGKI